VHLWSAPSENSGRSSILPSAGFSDEGEVAGAPLAALLTPEEIAAARVIKIDVEGAELQVVRGLVPCLEAARDDLEVVVEVGGNPDDPTPAGETAGAIAGLLRPLGFHAYRLANDYNAHAYLSQRAPERPVRLAGAVVRPGDLVFSRTDAERL
jgi:hypothetical protein